MVDLRAPCEFAQGSFPNTVNLPLMDDEERRKVGTCYKQYGQDAAIRLGHKLVSGPLKEERIRAWKAFVAAHPEGYIFCFRGGLRSRTVKQWLTEAGASYPLIVGGYKAMRRFLIDALDQCVETLPQVVLGGLTGSSKTGFVARHPFGVNLEGFANHRGSSFGNFPTPQPTQIAFENQLAVACLRQEAMQHRYLLLEDEGRIIGSINIPLRLHESMTRAPLVVLQEKFEHRVENILDEYVRGMFGLYVDEAQRRGMGPEESVFGVYSEWLLSSMDKLRKRLGGERHRDLRQKMEAALAEQSGSGDVNLHREWIVPLLEDYYDPMYLYQLNQKKERVIFEGSTSEVQEFLSSYRQETQG